jgi:hypothetical protein
MAPYQLKKASFDNSWGNHIHPDIVLPNLEQALVLA